MRAAVLIAVVLACVIGLVAPHRVLWLRPALEPAFALTMFCVGTRVTTAELVLFARTPWRVLVGVLAHYTVMPALAWAVARPFETPALRIGIVLVGCMCTAMASNVMTAMIAGDVVLSAAMSFLSTLLLPASLAIVLRLLADVSIPVPVAGMTWSATWMVVLPLLAGAALRARWSGAPRWWPRAASGAAGASIVLIVLLVVGQNGAGVARAGPGVVLALMALNLGGYLAALLLATALRFPSNAGMALVFSVGMKNAGLGAVLAVRHLDPIAAVPSTLYAVLGLLTASAALPLTRRLGERHAPR